MHPAATDRPVHSPALACESSFPERHFISEESPADWSQQASLASLPSTELDSYQSAAAKGFHEPSFASLWPQDWPYQAGQAQPLLHRSPIPTAGLMVETGLFPTPLQQTAPSRRAEWALFREPSPGDFLWNPTPPASNVEEDSDSTPGPDDSPGELSPQFATWPSARKSKRRSTHKVTKPSRAPAPKHGIPPLQTASRPRGYGPPDVDFSDIAAIFLDNVHPATNGAEIDVVFQDPSSSAKDDSKRIAHKLSEKSRRNRLTLAIREIQKLLPAGGGASAGSTTLTVDGEVIARPGVPSSKLDVVEMAVSFIRNLKEKNKEMAEKLKEAEERLGECRCRQDDGESRTSSPGDATS